MPNKNKKSAIYFYAKEYADKYGCSIREAIEDVYAEWKSMTPHEKAPYEQKLIEWKENQKKEKKEELEDVNTTSIIKVEDTYFGTDQVLTKERKDLIDELTTKMSLFKNLKKQKWYIIKFQTFCKTDEDIDDNCQYVLAEIGLIEYTLEEGITKEYHEFIKPESIPPGYTATCIANSKQYHQIPLDFQYAESNYSKIYSDILNFTYPTEDNYYTPIFCMNEDYNEVKYALRWLYNKYDVKNAMRLDRKIIDLQTLLMLLASVKKQMISYNVANEILTSYHFDYATNSRCDYHEELGISYCALGYTKRYAYLMSDQLCPIYEIVPLKGKHLPVEKLMCSSVNPSNDGDYRKPAKLLRESYNASNSRLARDNTFDSISCTTDYRYAKSSISTVPRTSNSEGRKKVSDTLFSQNRFESNNNKIKPNVTSNIIENHQHKLNNEKSYDEDNRSDNDDDDDDNWTTVGSTTNNSIIGSAISKVLGRGRVLYNQNK